MLTVKPSYSKGLFFFFADCTQHFLKKTGCTLMIFENKTCERNACEIN